MNELSALGHEQVVCAYLDERLAKAVACIPGVTVASPRQCLLRPWHGKRFDIIHAHEARGVYVAYWMWRLTGVPYLITRRMQQSPKSRFLTRRAYKHAKALVGISSEACRAIEAFCPGRTARRISSAHSNTAADPQNVSVLRNQVRTEKDSIVIGHAGALVDAHKGQRLLIEAGRRLRQEGYAVELVFMGTGPDREALETETAEYSWIRFMGQVAPIQDYLPALDIFAFPSRHEGLGSVLIEAMLAGVPIIATKVGGIPDLIKAGTTGWLVLPGDAGALTGALRELIASPKERRLLSAKARTYANSLGPDTMAMRYAELYGECLKGESQ